MEKPNVEIGRATISDLEGIVKLQSLNQKSNGGSLSGELTSSQIQEMMNDMPQIVARSNGNIVGFLLTTSQAVHHKRDIPIVNEMFKSYSGKTNAYIYGPVCVGDDQRGKGLAQLMFKELLRLEPNREGILFIKTDNEPSLRAHQKMGMHKVSAFHFKVADFDVFAY